MAKFMLIGDSEIGRYTAELISFSGKSDPLVLWVGSKPSTDLFVNTDYLSKTDLCDEKTVMCKTECANVIVFDETSVRLLRTMRRGSFAQAMKNICEKDTVLCGIGEGAVCLCAYGQVCSDRITSQRVTGLGLLDLTFCPHIVDEPQRTGWIKAIMKRTPRMTALAMDHAAIIIEDNQYSMIASGDDCRVRKCYWMRKQYYTDNLRSKEWHPLEKLMQKG